MACFLVRDFPLGRRPHKAIPQVVGQRGLEEFAVKKSKALGMCSMLRSALDVLVFRVVKPSVGFPETDGGGRWGFPRPSTEFSVSVHGGWF